MENERAQTDDDNPNYNLRTYRGVFVEARQLLEESDAADARQAGAFADDLALFCRNASGRLETVWKVGAGKVDESEIDDLREAREAAESLRDLAEDAHGNSIVAGYGSWTRSFLEDLERLDLETVDWRERAAERAESAHDECRRARRRVFDVLERIGAFEAKVVQTLGGSVGREAYVELGEIEREVGKIADRLDDPLFSGPDGSRG